MPVQFQIVMFAIVAAVLLFMLYNVLGKKVGRQPQEDARLPQPAPTTGGAPAAALTPGVDAATAAAVAGLKARDPAFDPARFVEGARQAYETIVRGYASGDRAALKPLLTPAVLDSFETGIAAREVRGETEQVEFLFPPRADLELASAEGDRAVAKVRFLAEIRSKILPPEAEATPGAPAEPRIEERRTAEHWTFERSLGAADPNWVLARNAAAREVDTSRLEARVAHQPPQQPVPQRTVRTARLLCRALAHQELVRTVQREGDGATGTVFAEGQERHRLAATQRRVRHQHSRPGRRRADDVGARHLWHLVADHVAQWREHRSHAPRRR